MIEEEHSSEQNSSNQDDNIQASSYNSSISSTPSKRFENAGQTMAEV